jgi:hypothetical protein
VGTGSSGVGASAGESGPGDGLGGAQSGYSWDRDRYNSPAGAPPSSYYPQASPRGVYTTTPETVVVTPPASGVVVAPAPGVVVAPAPGVVVTPGTAVVPSTPLICPNVNPADPRKC